MDDIKNDNYTQDSPGSSDVFRETAAELEKAAKKSETEKSPEPKESFGKSFLREFWSFLKLFAVAFVAAFLITRFVIVNADVPTGSMTNTIMEHDRLIGLRLSYLFSDPQRGDIIIFKYPDDETQNFVKRVIGVPGDVVVIDNGQVMVNGEVLDEPYIKEPMETYETLCYVVPENSYFVMGDNRNNSKDSRYWTTTNYVKKDQIIAKVLFKYFNMQDKKIEFKILN
jgi:signal peptidase I